MGRSKKRRQTPAKPAPNPAPEDTSTRYWWAPLAIGLLVILALGAWWLHEPSSPTVIAPPAPAATTAQAPATPPAHYVGAQTCGGCHQAQMQSWQGSHHAQAMMLAQGDAVKGRFDGVAFKADGSTALPFKRDDMFYLRTDGKDGQPADFAIKYTFGVYPLQQYLVEFPDGRYQALRASWDARPREAGGQRWFNQYPGEHIGAHDNLHWTGLNQNWNYMCADCHSTNFQRNYDATADTFKSTWSDINVACEACHGPGSRHLDWTKGSETQKAGDKSKGLAIALDERHGVHWVPNEASGSPVRSAVLSSHREVETCAVCHARRGVIAKDSAPTGRLMDTHDPALLTTGLYHADGQQLDEVYVYASFLQSKMYAQGVTCSDCHDPHSGKTRAQGNALCLSCHTASKFDTTAHHMHKADSAGSQCVASHMPAKHCMVVNPRPDHSIRVPRPDLTEKFGVPNACATCHADKGAAWAAQAIEKAHGPERKGYQHFLPALDTARKGAPGAASGLMQLAQDATSPAIARATAVNELQRYPSREALPTLQHALSDPDPLMRMAALESLLSFPPPVRAQLALAHVDDPVRNVRIKAARAVASLPDNLLDPAQREARDRAFAFWLDAQAVNADRPEPHFDIGIVYAERGDAAKAESEFRLAMKRQADFVPAYVNLADLYRSQGREDEASAVIEEGLKAAPAHASLLHAKGLALVRAGKTPEALAWLKRATDAAPDSARFAYVYAVALQSSGQIDAAKSVLAKALKVSPYDPALLFTLAAIERDAHDWVAARGYAERLLAVAPASGDAQQLKQSIEEAARAPK